MTVKPKYVIGCDEAGTGAIFGGFAVGVCVLPIDACFDVQDSKRYTSEKTRYDAMLRVTEHSLFHDVEMCTVEEIEVEGLGEVVRKMMFRLCKRAYQEFPKSLVVFDGTNTPHGFPYPCVTIPKADSLVCAVSGASVLAKVFRDTWVNAQAEIYDGYYLKSHKGYPTSQHIHAIKELGATPLHRKYARNLDPTS